MKKLVIELRKRDVKNIGHVLNEIAKAIEDGFHSGIEFPVNWHLEKVDVSPDPNQHREMIDHILTMVRNRAVMDIPRALNCGALSEDSEFRQSNALLPVALIENALKNNYGLAKKEWQKEAENLKKFI